MGLLDVIGKGMDDPKTQGLLGLAGSLLANSGYSRTPVSNGEVFGNGMQAYQQAYAAQQQQLQQQALAKWRMENDVAKQKQDREQWQADHDFKVANADRDDVRSAEQFKIATADRKEARQANEDLRRDIAGMRGANASTGWEVRQLPNGALMRVNARTGETAPIDAGASSPAPVKPMPASLQKVEAEDIEAIQTGKAISADMAALKTQIDNKKINLGLIANKQNELRNATGFSTDESRNYSSMRNTLEDMRNKSLMLNKGVQTEGDAQRAWDGLFSSLNDPKLVSKRLAEIQAINERAAALKLESVNFRRKNNNVDPIEDESLFDAKAAVGNPPNAAGKNPVKTGTYGGKKVVQYDDGSVEYAN